MSPRKYEMTRRATATGQTRARIVAATVDAHRELGILATSWDEIARRAGVGIGTVYRHFRTLDQLLPACGEVVEQALALPAAGNAPALFAGVSAPRARIGRLVTEVFGAYERGAPFIGNIRRERRQLPQLEDFHQRIEETLDALVREALRPLTPSRQAGDVVRALVDLPVWLAFTTRGFTSEQTIRTVTSLIECSLRSDEPCLPGGRLEVSKICFGSSKDKDENPPRVDRRVVGGAISERAPAQTRRGNDIVRVGIPDRAPSRATITI
jgi:AcrR family transcriptional regulator